VKADILFALPDCVGTATKQLPSSSLFATSLPLESLLPLNAQRISPVRARKSLGGRIEKGSEEIIMRGRMRGRDVSSEFKPSSRPFVSSDSSIGTLPSSSLLLKKSTSSSSDPSSLLSDASGL